jgi:hypothetical protein
VRRGYAKVSPYYFFCEGFVFATLTIGSQVFPKILIASCSPHKSRQEMPLLLQFKQRGILGLLYQSDVTDTVMVGEEI